MSIPFEMVIFDCDGVLIDSEWLAAQVDSICLADAGFFLNAEEAIDRYSGISLVDMLSDLERRAKRPSLIDVREFERNHERLIIKLFTEELKIIPGVVDVLDSLSCKVCVASSGIPERIFKALTIVGLFDRLYPHIFSASMVKRGKPFPDLFLYAAEQMDVEPARCVVIEDSVPGIMAAVAAEMKSIGFSGASHCRLGHSDRLYAQGATCVIESMSDLLPTLQTKW